MSLQLTASKPTNTHTLSVVLHVCPNSGGFLQTSMVFYSEVSSFQRLKCSLFIEVSSVQKSEIAITSLPPVSFWVEGARQVRQPLLTSLPAATPCGRGLKEVT